jgi:hypothetical protein
MKRPFFDASVWQMNDGTWRISQRTNAHLRGASPLPYDTGVWDLKKDAKQHLDLLERDLFYQKQRAQQTDDHIGQLLSAQKELLEVANRHRHLLSELHGGNAFSKNWLWQALIETDTAIAKVQPTINPKEKNHD